MTYTFLVHVEDQYLEIYQVTLKKVQSIKCDISIKLFRSVGFGRFVELNQSKFVTLGLLYIVLIIFMNEDHR